MTIFELIRQEVTAKQAAELYGLKFERGRAFCPWHDDGKHPALQFFRDGGCYCHSCHMHGDAIDITAQMLKLSPKAAAERIRQDFHLNQPVDKRPNPSTVAKIQREKTEREKKSERYRLLCDVCREADARLKEYTPETIDAEFDVLLGAYCKAQQERDELFEELAR